jgi:hypothetical protein
MLYTKLPFLGTVYYIYIYIYIMYIIHTAPVRMVLCMSLAFIQVGPLSREVPWEWN